MRRKLKFCETVNNFKNGGHFITKGVYCCDIYKSRGYSVLCLCLKLSWLLLVFVSGCTSLIVVLFQLFFFFLSFFLS